MPMSGIPCAQCPDPQSCVAAGQCQLKGAGAAGGGRGMPAMMKKGGYAKKQPAKMKAGGPVKARPGGQVKAGGSAGGRARPAAAPKTTAGSKMRPGGNTKTGGRVSSVTKGGGRGKS
jgi:hypothetical protein